MTDLWEENDEPELRAALSEAAELLLPLARATEAAGRWSPEVAGWLVMVRDSLASRQVSEAH